MSFNDQRKFHFRGVIPVHALRVQKQCVPLSTREQDLDQFELPSGEDIVVRMYIPAGIKQGKHT